MPERSGCAARGGECGSEAVVIEVNLPPLSVPLENPHARSLTDTLTQEIVGPQVSGGDVPCRWCVSSKVFVMGWAPLRAPLSHSREKKKRSTCRWVGFRIGPPPPIIQVNYGFRGRWMLIRRQELGTQTSHVWPPNLRLPLFRKKKALVPPGGKRILKRVLIKLLRTLIVVNLYYTSHTQKHIGFSCIFVYLSIIHRRLINIP